MTVSSKSMYYNNRDELFVQLTDKQLDKLNEIELFQVIFVKLGNSKLIRGIVSRKTKCGIALKHFEVL